MASSFNEGLTGPFLGLFFWVPLGMLLLWPVGPAGARPPRAALGLALAERSSSSSDLAGREPASSSSVAAIWISPTRRRSAAG